MSAKIQVILGPDCGQTFLIPANGCLNIGRSHTTDTKLSDLAVSRLHCRIEFDGQQAVLFNISTKGTRVNDKPTDQKQLHHGDIIRIGDTEIRFALTSLSDAETLSQDSKSIAPPTLKTTDPS